MLLLSLSFNIYSFCFFFILQAVPRGLCPPALSLYLTENLPVKNRGKKFLLYVAFFPIGLAISTGVGYIILDDFDHGNWKLYL